MATPALMTLPEHTETIVYSTDHGVPVSLQVTRRCLHTDHRLEVGTGEAVIVLARRGDRFALVRRRRPTVGETFLELPRGLVDQDETVQLAAGRHTLRSTGYDLYDPLVLSEHYLDTSIYPSRVTVLYGVASREPEQQVMEPHVESVEWWGVSSLRDKIRHGEIRDGHTLTALAHYMARR